MSFAEEIWLPGVHSPDFQSRYKIFHHSQFSLFSWLTDQSNRDAQRGPLSETISHSNSEPGGGGQPNRLPTWPCFACYINMFAKLPRNPCKYWAAILYIVSALLCINILLDWNKNCPQIDIYVLKAPLLLLVENRTRNIRREGTDWIIPNLGRDLRSQSGNLS